MLELLPLFSQLLVALVGSFALAQVVRSNAHFFKVVDIPNERSLHQKPKPRGGGLGLAAMSLVFLIGSGVEVWKLALFAGGALVALVGWFDDAGGVRARNRFLIHSLAAVLVLAGLGTTPSLDLGFVRIESIALWIPAFLFIVWMLNLYNFMDGIDGLAGLEAFVAALLLGGFAFVRGAQELAFTYSVIAASSAGFLLLNWPPAKIFMGDVGSGFLGFVFGALAIYGEVTAKLPLSFSLIIFGCFIVDSGMTLIRRLLSGERVYVAHKKHAYQKAVQRGYSHRQVTLTIGLITLFWLGPLAWLVGVWPQWQLGFIFVGYVPLIWACHKLGAGTSS